MALGSEADGEEAANAASKAEAKAKAPRSWDLDVLSDNAVKDVKSEESSNEDPDRPTKPGRSAAPYFSSLQRDNFEPFTVLPGRCTVLQRDVGNITKEFKKRLQAKAAAGEFGDKELPFAGGFIIFREIFKEWGFSVIVEYHKHEVDRDCFQYICGICWRTMANADNLVDKVAIVFLIYLLSANQQKQVFAVPVSHEVLEQLIDLRQQCLAQEAFAEFHKIIWKLLKEDKVSIGTRASYRSLHFDAFGHLAERKRMKLPIAGTRAWTAKRKFEARNRAKVEAKEEESAACRRAERQARLKKRLDELQQPVGDYEASQLEARRETPGEDCAEPVTDGEEEAPSKDMVVLPEVSHIVGGLTNADDRWDEAKQLLDGALVEDGPAGLPAAESPGAEYVPPILAQFHAAKKTRRRPRRDEYDREYDEDDDEEAHINPFAEEYFRKAFELGDRRLILTRVPKGRTTCHSALLGMDKAMSNGVAEKLLSQIRKMPTSCSARSEQIPVIPEPGTERAKSCESDASGSGEQLVVMPMGTPSPATPELAKALFGPPKDIEKKEDDEEKFDDKITFFADRNISDMEDMSDVQYEIEPESEESKTARQFEDVGHRPVVARSVEFLKEDFQ
ncbi:unnamed protein product [Symbiodinium sp. CCMP2456]|nr:unnamed protein product [Symbiodinium sp. CCMP2456]